MGSHLVFTSAKDASAFKVNLVGLELKNHELSVYTMIPRKGRASMPYTDFNRKVGEKWPELDVVKQHSKAEKITGTYQLTEATSSQLIFEAK